MEFSVLKFGGIVKKYQPIILTIGDDEFFYKKKKDKEKPRLFHISTLERVYLEQNPKEKSEFLLIIEISISNKSKETDTKNKKESKQIKLGLKDEKTGKTSDILFQIKSILNTKKLQYKMNLFLFNFNEKFNKKINKEKLNTLLDEETGNQLKQKIKEAFDKKQITVDSISQKMQKGSELFNANNIKISSEQNENLDNNITKKVLEIVNWDFNLHNNENNINILNDNTNIKYNDILKIITYYKNFCELLKQIRFIYSLKRFKNYDKQYLLECQKINNNNIIEVDNLNISNDVIKNDDLSQSKSSTNSNILFRQNDSDLTDESLNRQSNKINHINTKEDIENKIKTIPTINENMNTKILSLFNINTKLREELKQLLLTSNKKIFICIKCNSLLTRILIGKSNCNFDNSCTNRSFLFCRRCKINFCTQCIIYQSGLKCGKNHTLFQNKTGKPLDKCFICEKNNIFPYYECKHCKEQICYMCCIGMETAQNTCQNCNNELIPRRCFHTQCDRCEKFGDCFYYCVCCDFNFCLNCTRIPKNKCPGFHNIKEINNDENESYWNSFYVRCCGKCSLCHSSIINKKVYGCLRCSFFLCEECKNKNKEEDDDK